MNRSHFARRERRVGSRGLDRKTSFFRFFRHTNPTQTPSRAPARLEGRHGKGTKASATRCSGRRPLFPVSDLLSVTHPLWCPPTHHLQHAHHGSHRVRCAALHCTCCILASSHTKAGEEISWVQSRSPFAHVDLRFARRNPIRQSCRCRVPRSSRCSPRSAARTRCRWPAA